MASSLRFLHCAGFSLDSPIYESHEVPEGGEGQRNQGLWRTFETVLSLCRTEKIDFLLIAGDIFEQEYVHKDTVERLVRSFAKLEGTSIFIAPGKRDPLIQTSAYRLANWPSNVHIFLGGISSVKIPLHNLTVYGAGWTSYCQEGNILDGFQTIKDGTLQVMVLHAKVNYGQDTERFVTIQPEQIASSGLTYLALGNQEVWDGIQQEGDTFWANCGLLEAGSFQKSGPYGVLLGEIDKQSVRGEFRKLGQRNYSEERISIESDVESIAVRDGFPSLSQVFGAKLEEGLFRANSAEASKHWELVRKIGLAALEQGRDGHEN